MDIKNQEKPVMCCMTGFLLSVPLIGKAVDLVGKFGKAFIRASAVFADHAQQALACRDEAVKDGIRPRGRLGTCFFLDAFRKDAVFQKVDLRSGIGSEGIERKLVFQPAGKEIAYGGLAMRDEYALRLGRKAAYPAHEPAVVRMCADPFERAYFGKYGDVLAKQLDLLCTVEYVAP